METKFIGLSLLAQNLGLPSAYLRDLATTGKIPSLNVCGKLRFDPDAVERALGELATGGKIEECKKVSTETGFRGQIG
jgi:hypothetical protein